VNLADALSVSGATCTISGGPSQTVLKSSSITPAYTCSFTSAPSASSGTNTATASWSAGTYFTPSGSALGTANYTFAPLTVTDTFKGTLGTVTNPSGSTAFTYSRTVTNAAGGQCQSYPNTATINTTPNQSSSQTVTVCNTASGALTMGYWQNKNGQGIISGGVFATRGRGCGNMRRSRT